MRIPDRNSLPPTSTVYGQLQYQYHNVITRSSSTEAINEYFHLLAPPNTKLARDHTGNDKVTAPIVLRRLEYPFVLCEVTIAGELEMDWDQGGIVIFSGGVPGLSERGQAWSRTRPYVSINRQLEPRKCRWARVGLELVAGELGVSSVVANPGCSNDWCFTPLFNMQSSACLMEDLLPSLRVKLERVADDLWMWYKTPSHGVDSDVPRTPEMLSRQWRKCREVAGFFDDASSKGGVWVGCYASRPNEIENSTPDDSLFMEFEDLEVL